jgi:hypothetical protein
MNRVQYGSTAPKSAAQQSKREVQTDSGHAAKSAPLGLAAMDMSAAMADEPALSDLSGENYFGENYFGETSFAQEPFAQEPFAGQPDSSSLPDAAKARHSTDSVVLSLPPVQFLGQLLNQHPTIFWSGVWVITLLCSGIAVTGLMNPDLSSQQEPPDQTGVGAVLRATRLDPQKPASPAVSFGLLAVSCAGCCLLLSRRFQSPQSLSRPGRSKHWRSPAKSAIAAELEAIATLVAESAPDSNFSAPLPSRQPWIDAALSATQSNPPPDAPPDAPPDVPASSAAEPQPLDYLSYLRVHAQVKAQSQRARIGGRSPQPQPNSQNHAPNLHPIAPYAPDPALPVAFLSPPADSLSPAFTAQPSLPAAPQPPLSLSQPLQPQPEALQDPASTLAELRRIQAKRALREVE